MRTHGSRTRSSFGVAIALVGLLLGCFSNNHAGVARAAVLPLTGHGPNLLEVEAFRFSLSSPLALQEKVTYELAADLMADGLSNGTHPVYILTTPRFIVTPNVPEDVVKAVQFGATHKLKVAARGTGHTLSGTFLPEGGITIDMRNMLESSFDNTTKIATLQTGLESGVALAAVLPYGYAPIIGTCHRVGVAGFSLQGGNGWASRWHGPAADFIQSLDVVTVGSDSVAVRRNVTAASDPDLFFGLRGAGGALGVVISFSTLSFPIPPVVKSVFYTFAVSRAEEVLTWFWNTYIPTTPPWMEPAVFFYAAGTSPCPASTACFQVDVFNIGPASAVTDAAFATLDVYAASRYGDEGSRSIAAANVTQSYLDFQTGDGICGNLTEATYWNTLYAANGTLVRGEFDPALIAVLAQQIATAPPGGSISIEASPGYPTIAQPLSAWSFYGAYQLFIGSTWPRTGPEPGVDETNINWIKTATQAILPFTVGRYINQLMMEMPGDAELSYEAGIFARLKGVKAQYDPHNLFRDLYYQHANTTYTAKDAISTTDPTSIFAMPFADVALAPSMAASVAAPGPNSLEG